MPGQFTLGPLTLRTYPALLGLAVGLGLAVLWGVAQRRGARNPGHWLDVGLGGVLGGVIGARVVHVLLNWAYFRTHIGEAFRIGAGGLDWHGAVVGGLLGLALAARWRAIPLRDVTDAVALVWPLGLMAGWAGCLAEACGIGAEVWTLADYPAWMVSELPDRYGMLVPRYNAQGFGVALGGILLLVIAGLTRFGWLRGQRLWLVLALTGAGMFAIGFVRGEGLPGPLPNLTWEQVLDLGVIALGVVFSVGAGLRVGDRSKQ